MRLFSLSSDVEAKGIFKKVVVFSLVGMALNKTDQTLIIDRKGYNNEIKILKQYKLEEKPQAKL